MERKKERKKIETLKRESDWRQSHLESRMNETTSEVEAAGLKMNSLEREREKMTKAVFQERLKLQDVKLEAATMKHELENQRRNRIEQELLPVVHAQNTILKNCRLIFSSTCQLPDSCTLILSCFPARTSTSYFSASFCLCLFRPTSLHFALHLLPKSRS